MGCDRTFGKGDPRHCVRDRRDAQAGGVVPHCLADRERAQAARFSFG
jgi:hypothetical protein